MASGNYGQPIILNYVNNSPLPKDTAPTPTTKIVSSVPRVEQLSNDTTTETMRDTTYFSISTMRGWDIGQNSPLEEVSLGRNCLSGKDATWEMTPFLQMPFVFPFRFDCTPKEATTIVSIEYQSFFQTLSGTEKMKLIIEIIHNMYRASSLFSLVAVGPEDFLVTSNPSKEMETWKVKCKDME